MKKNFFYKEFFFFQNHFIYFSTTTASTTKQKKPLYISWNLFISHINFFHCASIKSQLTSILSLFFCSVEIKSSFFVIQQKTNRKKNIIIKFKKKKTKTTMRIIIFILKFTDLDILHHTVVWLYHLMEI
jgi:hypothetical protein